MTYDRTWATLKVLDDYGRTKTKRVTLVTTSAAQAEADGVAVRAAFGNCMNGAVISDVISGEHVIADTPAAGANVDTGMTISCQLAGKPQKAVLKFPTPDPSILNPDGTLDLTDANVLALEALFVTATPAIATISDGETIDGFVSGSLDK